MKYKRQTSLMMRPSTSLPWSLRIERGMPNRLKTCSTNILAMGSASLLRSGEASAHLVNESMHVSIHKCPCSDFGSGPVRSMYQRSKGAPGTTGCNWLQRALLPKFSPMVPIALEALSAETLYIFFPVMPVEASPNLLHRFLFFKVSSHCSSMTLVESALDIRTWEQ